MGMRARRLRSACRDGQHVAMPLTLTVAVIGDYDPAFEPHAVTNAALAHSAGQPGVGIEVVWAATKPLDEDLSPVESAQALLCAPGSPHGSLTGALRALRFGREHAVPVLGTCAGCQHAVIEYARNVLGFEDAQHAEYDPYGSRLFVSELACSLAGKTMPVTLDGDSRAAMERTGGAFARGHPQGSSSSA